MSSTADLRRAGVSIWLDDLSRGDIVSGRLAALITDRDVTGITTNPTIFATAVLQHPDAYAQQLDAVRRSGASPREAAIAIVTDDVRSACDILLPTHTATSGADGFVSIEVTPDAAHDVDATLAEADQFRTLVDRPNVLVKIPSTAAGVHALEEATARGFSINMTLLFGIPRYREVIAAYRTGLTRAATAGIDLGSIHSVASFFVSRVDVEADSRLAVVGTPAALALRGRVAVANARLAYAEYEASLRDPARGGRSEPATPALGLDRRQGSRHARHPLHRRPDSTGGGRHDAHHDTGGVLGPRPGAHGHRPRRLRGGPLRA